MAVVMIGFAFFALLRMIRADDAPAASLGTPHLPAKPYEYADIDLPLHFQRPHPRFGSVAGADNTPVDNPITNEGAALGRVLFYDRRLSANDTTSCSSCHLQKHGFSDPARLSKGLHGKRTARHSMGLTNARFYVPGRFFWDERAATLEDQVLMPIQDKVEMGMKLDDLEQKLAGTDFYPPLFEAAFGSPEIDRNRISRALAQFVRSLVSFQSKYDRAYSNSRGGFPDFSRVFTQQEQLGLRLFSGGPGRGRSARCDRCHGTTAQISRAALNNGLDLNTKRDDGVGGGRFKAPSLRNIAVRSPYMHDGRFKSLRQVIEHYNSGVQNHPNLARSLSGRLGRGRGNRFGRRNGNNNPGPRRLNFTKIEINALVAFLKTLTDQAFLTDPKFSDPFLDPSKPKTARKRSRSRKRRDNPDKAKNREKLAQKTLDKAKSTSETRGKIAKLKLLVKRFKETEAAKKAGEILKELAKAKDD